MKKVLLTGIWCLWIGISFAQTTDLRDDTAYLIDSTICFQFNPDLGALIPSIREVTMATNPFGNITEKRTDAYDLNAGDWLPSKLLLSSYDELENLSQFIEQEWNSSSQVFENKIKKIYTLNGSGQATEVIQQTWDNGAWINVEKENYQYDSGPNAGATLFLFQKWENGAWQNQFQVFNSYNQNLLASTLFQTYTDGEWVNGNRSFESYNDDDLLIKSKREFWNAGIGDWALSSQVLYNYSGQNNTQTLTQLWDDFNQDWLNSSLVMYSYDSDNRRTEELSQNWINGAWINLFKTSLQYDDAGNLTRSDGELWVNEAWRAQNACDLYWSVFSTAINQTFENQIQCTLPNPFQTGKSIVCDQLLDHKNYELGVFDINGIQHFSKKITTKNDFFINKNLSSGMYVLIVKNEDGMVFRQKLIIVQ